VETDLNTLTILAEVTTAFVAFAAIIACLRLTFGEQLSSFQTLLMHFFTESGMLAVSISLFPLVLIGFWQDELIVARHTTLYTLVITGAYLIFYIYRRVRIHAPTPFASLLVMIGYGIWWPLLVITYTGIYWQPSLEIIAAFCFWALISGVVIFTYFLTNFVQNQSKRA
jgi:hypothetical protein